ncbi:NnrU family protein [Limibacillus halophilus]|uniref:Putative membrane protein n=2 Tax=Limibacillus TaxID=1848396 RepID=A0A839SVP3_9PROT|nr:NnrU family protein [Limibacillus halophilus]MBB3066368.1 putative membrane protein [Limibacillus halophilus]
MTGSLESVFLATLAFVGGHFLFSAQPLRGLLVDRLGQSGFLAAASVLHASTFIWLLLAYRSAPFDPIWEPPRFLLHLPALIMVPAVFLVVTGLTTRSATAVGGDAVEVSDPTVLNSGILRITRHPFLWGTSLWALAHLLVNGDGASILLMGGVLVLSLGGMLHIDRKREAEMGAAWGPIRMTTSLIPFAALMTGRCSMDWRGIGWWRSLLSLVVYAALLALHSTVMGVSPLPL